MGLKIERKSDSRVIKSILHRVADIPGGVTIKTADLGGSALLESTPIGPLSGDDAGLYGVLKTATIVTAATNVATTYEVAKGHHFKVGDFFGTADTNGQAITAIDKTTNADKDVITVGTTLGAAITAGTVAYATGDGDTVAAVGVTAIAGSSYDVETTNNLFVDAWVIGVVKDANAVPADTAAKALLKGIVYV